MLAFFNLRMNCSGSSISTAAGSSKFVEKRMRQVRGQGHNPERVVNVRLECGLGSRRNFLALLDIDAESLPNGRLSV